MILNDELLCVYPQNKAEYRLANTDFIKIHLCNGEKSVYCNLILDQQFSALQEIYISTGKKSLASNKKCFSRRVEDIISRSLKELGVI